MGIRRSGEPFAVTAPSLAITGDATIAGTLGVTGAATVGGTLGVTGITTLAALLKLADVGWAFTSDAGLDSGFVRNGGLTQWIEDGNVLYTHNAAGTLAQVSTTLYLPAANALQLEGDLQLVNQPAIKTADYNLVQGNNAQFFIMNGANLNFNLPASAKVGALVYVKNINATNCTIVRNTGQTIDAAAANYVLGPNAAVILTANGTLSWQILAAYAGLGAG